MDPMSIASELFHPLIARWFDTEFAAPTEAQAEGWPAIALGRDTLIAAPTGSGKTLAAFLSGLDGLLREGLSGALTPFVRLLYISPLKALGNDVEQNLLRPLAGLRALAALEGFELPELRVSVRSGDTPAAMRARQIRLPPHIFITTPESLHILLTSEGGRRALGQVHTVIVDEIHAVAATKRGAHLALSLERLDALVLDGGSRRPTRVGLSATQRPIETVGRLLVGHGRAAPVLVDRGHLRALKLSLEVPEEALSGVASNAQMEQVYDRMAALVTSHRSTLIFANTRRLSERTAQKLELRLGVGMVQAHHGALSRKLRLSAEQRLKSGQLRCVVATASLELGIDIGDVDLVIQLGSPRSVSTFLQRVGRSGHAVGAVPEGCLFATTRDQLVELTALLEAVSRGELETLSVPEAPLDVLAQHLVAEVSATERDADFLFALTRRAMPYGAITREAFDAVLHLHADGLGGHGAHGGRRFAFLHHDETTGIVRARRGARLASITSGGAIPDRADYQVVLEPEDVVVGTVDEDFAIESMSGDVFILGTQTWRVRRVAAGKIRVEAAPGASPTIPFWVGEAPSRSVTLSAAVGRLRARVEIDLMDSGGGRDTSARHGIASDLVKRLDLTPFAAEQLVDYLATSRLSLGALPTTETLIVERFFDDAGGMQLVLHAPLGTRINRAWGLALRKCFCRTFDFELQASANDDGIVLSLGPQHSFPLETVFDFVRTTNLDRVLTQALLTGGQFTGRFRWVAQISLALPRFSGGRRVPPPIQRMRADDLLAAVFPSAQACQENVTGDLEPPDHPLVNQTLWDCLHDLVDVEGLRALLARIEAGQVRLVCVDATEPSLMSHELLNAMPWAFLDDAPLEERRARAVNLRRGLSPEDAKHLGHLDARAIAAVTAELQFQARDADELHDVLSTFIFLPDADLQPVWPLLESLVRAGRAVGHRGGHSTSERRELMYAALPTSGRGDDDAILKLVAAHLEFRGPTSVETLSTYLTIDADAVYAAMVGLESRGAVLRGHFNSAGTTGPALEFCDRRVLARIHRLTLANLRREIEPLSATELTRFFFRWQHVDPSTRLQGIGGTAQALAQLQGLEAPIGAWESALLPSRVSSYENSHLDALGYSGEIAWARLCPHQTQAAATKAIPVSLFRRVDLGFLAPPPSPEEETPRHSATAALLLEHLRTRGPSFHADLIRQLGRLPTELDTALLQLVASGHVTADAFAALRGLLPSQAAQRRNGRAKRPDSRPSAPWFARGQAARPGSAAGRWSAFLPPDPGDRPDAEGRAERWVHQLLERWGVVFRDLVSVEPYAPPWRELYPILRRMEARGEVRGGRFVTRFNGEQFALPIALLAMRASRRRGEVPETPTPVYLRIAAVDPLNLTGLLTPCVAPGVDLPNGRIPAQGDNAILYADGLPIAARLKGRLVVLDPSAQTLNLTPELVVRPPPPPPLLMVPRVAAPLAHR